MPSAGQALWKTTRTLAIVIGLAGCGLNASSMVPEAMPTRANPIDEDVAIRTVSGEHDTTVNGAVLVTNADLREALVLSLEQSKLFRSVRSNNPTVYLDAIIRRQDQRPIPPSEHRATVAVEYRFYRTNGGDEPIWDESFLSDGGSTIQPTAVREKLARQAALRDNLRAMLTLVERTWPR